MSQLKTALLTFLLTFALSPAWAAPKSYTPGNYAVDNAHTRVSFIAKHFVVSEVEGRFNEVKGSFVLAPKFTDSSVTATIPVNTIDTGIKQRDDHLKSPDFFDAKKFPEMKLVSKSIKGKPEKFKLTAAVTIKDVTKDVVFDGKYTGSVVDPWGNERAAIQLSGAVNRKDFNINYNDMLEIGPVVGEIIQVRIWTEGILQKEEDKK